MKNKSDTRLHEIAASGLFRVNAEGRIETCRRWNGHRDVEVDWYVCDRADGKGYYYVSHRMTRVKSHRLAFLLYHPHEDLTGWEVNHIDGCKTNNSKSNLEKCGAARQSQHAFETGLNCNFGNRHHLARMDPLAVREALHQHALGVPYARIARRYGVTPRTIVLICQGKTWKHLNSVR